MGVSTHKNKDGANASIVFKVADVSMTAINTGRFLETLANEN